MKDFVNEQSLEKIINKLSGLALFHEWRLIGLYDENNIIGVIKTKWNSKHQMEEVDSVIAEESFIPLLHLLAMDIHGELLSDAKFTENWIITESLDDFSKHTLKIHLPGVGAAKRKNKMMLGLDIHGEKKNFLEDAMNVYLQENSNHVYSSLNNMTLL